MLTNTPLAKPVQPLQQEDFGLLDAKLGSVSPPFFVGDSSENELAALAHDLRTVANVLTDTSNALAQTMLSHQQKQLVETMQFGTDNLLSLVNNFLDFTKLKVADIDFNCQPFDLCEQIFSLQRALQLRANAKKLAVLAKIDPAVQGLFPILDLLRLRKILFNLLDNAIKFTSKGSVTLYVRLARPDILEFRVCDTGMGIAPDELNHIFKPFWQIKNQTAGGTGLGLTIVQELVERQGGQVRVESRLNEGSIFIVTLPFERSLPGLPVTMTPQSILIEPDALRGCSLLAVDDNPLSQRLLRRLFEAWDCQFAFASSSAQALDLTENRAFDLILLDVNLPDGNGTALASLIRRSSSGKNCFTPLIGLSGATLSKTTLRSFDTFVEKPFTPPVLQAVLYSFWQKIKDERPKVEPVQLDFTYLLSFCEGDRQFAAEIIDLFLLNAPEAIYQLQVAAQEHTTRISFINWRIGLNLIFSRSASTRSKIGAFTSNAFAKSQRPTTA